MSRLSWSCLFLSSAAVLLVTAAEASAQSCTTAPSCAELGYTATSCYVGPSLKCPFDKSKLFCVYNTNCQSLGYNKTINQCAAQGYIPCPFNASYVYCSTPAIGEIKLWPTATAPKGWKLCDGSSLSTTTYKDLYAVIGTTYGGYGSYFYLPNLKGRVAVGAGYATQYTYTLAETGGTNFVQLSSDQIPDHKHLTPYSESHTGVPWGYYGSGKWGSHGGADTDNRWYYTSYMTSRSGYRNYPSSKTSSWGSYGTCDSDRTYSCSTTYHENRMPFLALNYIIYTGVY